MHQFSLFIQGKNLYKLNNYFYHFHSWLKLVIFLNSIGLLRKILSTLGYQKLQKKYHKVPQSTKIYQKNTKHNQNTTKIVPKSTKKYQKYPKVFFNIKKDKNYKQYPKNTHPKCPKKHLKISKKYTKNIPKIPDKCSKNAPKK